MSRQKYVLLISLILFLLFPTWVNKTSAEDLSLSKTIFLSVEPPPGWEPPARNNDDDEEEEDEEADDPPPDFTGESLPSCNSPCVTHHIKGKTFEVVSITSVTIDYPKDPSTDPMGDDVHIDPDAEMGPVESSRQTHRRGPHRDVRNELRQLRRGQLRWFDIEPGQCVVDESDQNQTVERDITFFDPSKKSRVSFRKECQCDTAADAVETPAGTRDETWTMRIPYWGEAGFAYLSPRFAGGDITPADLTDPRTGAGGVTLAPNQKLGEPEPAMGRTTVPILVKKEATITYRVTRDVFTVPGTCVTHFVMDSIFLPERQEDWLPDQSDDKDRVTPNTRIGEPVFYNQNNDSELEEWKRVAKQAPQDEETGTPLEGSVILIPKESTSETAVSIYNEPPQLDNLKIGDTLVITAKCHQKQTYIIGRDKAPRAFLLAKKPLKFIIASGDEQALNSIIRDLAKSGVKVIHSSIKVIPKSEYAEVLIRKYTTKNNNCPNIPRTSLLPLKEGEPGWYEGNIPRQGE